MSVRITLIGNEGFHIAGPSGGIFIDAFYDAYPHVGGYPLKAAQDALHAKLILVTHAHGDHFNPAGVAQAARRDGATVVGPQMAIKSLRGELPDDKLIELDPADSAVGEHACSCSADAGMAKVTAFRTFHSRGHNSYLVDAGGFRFFHDGDNEHCQRTDVSQLGGVDVLFQGPWKGSGWVEFVEAVKPAKWFLMHLTDGELDDHFAGRFLPDICDRTPLPDRLVVLRPGEYFDFDGGRA